MRVDLVYLNENNNKAVDLGPLLLALGEEVERRGLDAAALSVRCDWVQYRSNFRSAIEPRPYGPTGAGGPAAELAVDVRRLDGLDLDADIAAALARLLDDEDPRLLLEGWCRPSSSVVWAFNAAYWRHLSDWEAAFERPFVAALPGGVSDGTNPAFWQERLEAFLDVLDRLAAAGTLPEEVYVLELGVGGGHQARLWLDTFESICRERGRDFYERVRYLMADFSADVLHAARRTVEEHGDKVSCLTLDAVDPLQALRFLRYKVLFIHASNLYDNLPTDEVVRRDDALYEVQVRAALPAAAVAQLQRDHGVGAPALPAVIARLLRVGPESFDDPAVGMRFWGEVWSALELEERFVRLDGGAIARLVQVPGADVEVVLDEVRGDVRVHLSTVALRSFANTLPLLHPLGTLQVLDLFVHDLGQYQRGFRGPGKLDGSVVNWLNGPLFRRVGERLGHVVHLEPFAHRPGSRISVLSTTPKP